MPILSLASKDEFELMTKDHRLCCVHFYAEWVDQCSHMERIIKEMADIADYEMVRFIKIPAEEVPEISLRYEVNAVPTFILLDRGTFLDRVEGANPSLLINKLKSQINSIKVYKTPFVAPTSPPSIEERLKKLINTAEVMVFMKGDAAHPKCGFSSQMIEILNKLKVLYKTFDILTDNEVREGLKKYSNWPTYPQLYICGELIGGLDVVKEMVESGELKQKLPAPLCKKDILYSLINRHPVMLFMKGNRDKPRCGFSKKIIEILDNTNVSYETYDILEDDEVRSGLKLYSNWPTYPQLYVNGELIGGLDVVQELQNAGQLITQLTVKK